LKVILINIIVLFLIIHSVAGNNIDSLSSNTQYQIPSNILSTISLNVDYGGTPPPDLGIAKLEWVFNAGSTDKFTIYRSIESAVWEIISNSVPGSQSIYNDTIPDGYCNVFIEYKVEAIDDVTGETVTSDISGKEFSESRQPEKPVLDSVSVNSNDNIILGWDTVANSDVVEIIIYRKVGDNWPDSTSVTIPYTTFYEDQTQLPCLNKNIQYAIATVDGCGNKSPKTELTAQRPIFFYLPEYNLCSKTISLSWEPYINALPPFNKYEIWSSINGGEYTLISTVASTENTYEYHNVDNATDYNFFVRAVFGDFNYTSTSCTKSIITGNFIEPDSIYLANADVLHDNNFIELTIDVDLDPNTCTWQIMRSEAGGVIQTLLATLSRNDVDTSPYIYLDTTANGSEGFYNYSIKVYDSCDALSLVSDTMKTIYLTGEQLSIDENELTWNTFKGFDGGVSRYYIFRILSDGVIPIIPFDSVSSADTNYINDVSSIAADETIFSYWIQAIEGDSNSFGYKETSNSNIISFFKETDFYFPNAFRPGSNIDANRIFKPTAIGFGGSGYLLQIYNRWGQLIFESTDYEVGWDGTYNNNISPQGAYVYRLIYKNVFDISKQQRGTVMLVN